MKNNNTLERSMKCHLFIRTCFVDFPIIYNKEDVIEDSISDLETFICHYRTLNDQVAYYVNDLHMLVNQWCSVEPNKLLQIAYTIFCYIS